MLRKPSTLALAIDALPLVLQVGLAIAMALTERRSHSSDPLQAWEAHGSMQTLALWMLFAPAFAGFWGILRLIAPANRVAAADPRRELATTLLNPDDILARVFAGRLRLVICATSIGALPMFGSLFIPELRVGIFDSHSARVLGALLTYVVCVCMVIAVSAESLLARLCRPRPASEYWGHIPTLWILLLLALPWFFGFSILAYGFDDDAPIFWACIVPGMVFAAGLAWVARRRWSQAKSIYPFPDGA